MLKTKIDKKKSTGTLRGERGGGGGRRPTEAGASTDQPTILDSSHGGKREINHRTKTDKNMITILRAHPRIPTTTVS